MCICEKHEKDAYIDIFPIDIKWIYTFRVNVWILVSGLNGGKKKALHAYRSWLDTRHGDVMAHVMN